MAEKDLTVLIELKNMVLEGIRTGVVRPLKTNVFTWDKAEDAFRFMASGKHVGKIVIKVNLVIDDFYTICVHAYE